MFNCDLIPRNFVEFAVAVLIAMIWLLFLLFVHRKAVDNGKKKGKVGTKWDKGGNNKDMASLDFSSDKGAAGDATANGIETSEAEVRPNKKYVWFRLHPLNN